MKCSVEKVVSRKLFPIYKHFLRGFPCLCLTSKDIGLWDIHVFNWDPDCEQGCDTTRIASTITVSNNNHVHM